MKNTTTKTTYTMLNPDTKTPPKIVFSRKSLKWIKNLIKQHNGEVGFFGIVDSMQDYTFYIRDIFYPKQQLVSSSTCEISTEGGTLIAQWLLEHDRSDDIGKMILWGHSHHSMGVEPSAQDNTQAMDLIQSTGQNLIRIIVNKEEFMNVSFFDFEKKIRFDHVKWDTETINNNDEFVIKKIEKITEIINSNKNPLEKLEEINKTSLQDLEEDLIITKIEELKKINIPNIETNQTNTFSYGNFNKGFEDEFDHLEGGYHYDNREYSKNDYRSLSFLNGFSSKKGSRKSKKSSNITISPPKTYLDDTYAEVDRVMDQWDKI